MKFFCLFIFLLSLISMPVSSQSAKNEPVHLILDTDIGPDYDDVGAIAIFHTLADKKEMVPLAILASNKNEFVCPVISLLNTYFGRPDLPIGAPKGFAPNIGSAQHWPEMILGEFAHSVRSTDEVPNAVLVYRKILASQPDHSVTIATIGFLTNLANLLDSKPDEQSSLSGIELVRKKVKLLVSMAGKFPQGREFNLFTDTTSSAMVFKNWPSPIQFSGYEIGATIKTGAGLISDNTVLGPVKQIFSFCMSKSAEDRNGHMSWDQTVVLVAVRGAAPYFGLQRGHITIKGGTNAWVNDINGSQAYLTPLTSNEQMSRVLENLMSQ